MSMSPKSDLRSPPSKLIKLVPDTEIDFFCNVYCILSGLILVFWSALGTVQKAEIFFFYRGRDLFVVFSMVGSVIGSIQFLNGFANIWYKIFISGNSYRHISKKVGKRIVWNKMNTMNCSKTNIDLVIMRHYDQWFPCSQAHTMCPIFVDE